MEIEVWKEGKAEGWPWRRREGHRREGRERQRSEREGGWKEEVRLVMRGRDKEGERDEGRSAVIRKVGERLDSIEHRRREFGEC